VRRQPIQGFAELALQVLCSSFDGLNETTLLPASWKRQPAKSSKPASIRFCPFLLQLLSIQVRQDSPSWPQ
jgi:hypothetical protein